MEIVPVDKPAAAINGRPCRFPQVVGGCGPSWGSWATGKHKHQTRTSGAGSTKCQAGGTKEKKKEPDTAPETDAC